MSLPLVLAGPILRRVEPNLVSVWIALSRPASVTLTLWEGRTKAGAADHLLRSDPATPTMRFGERLQLEWQLDPAVSTARLPPLVLQPLLENAVRHGIEPADLAHMFR